MDDSSQRGGPFLKGGSPRNVSATLTPPKFKAEYQMSVLKLYRMNYDGIYFKFMVFIDSLKRFRKDSNIFPLRS